MTKVKYCYSMNGESSLFRKVFQEISDNIKPVLDDLGWIESGESFSKIKALQIYSQPQMNFFSDASTYIAIFIMSSFANELIGIAIEGTVKQQILKTVKKITNCVQSKKKTPLVYEIISYHDDISVWVLIQIIINNTDELGIYFYKISEALKAAREWIKHNGKKANIHCYIIKEGKFSPVPEFFNSLEEVRQKQIWSGK